MESYPPTFDPEAYCRWHEATFPEDAPLREKLDAIRARLRQESREELRVLADLLTYYNTYCSNEIYRSTSLRFNYDIPLLNLISAPDAREYDLLFKSTESIVNKLWRKNGDDSRINLAAMPLRITDLIRTEVIAPTLGTARELSERLNDAFRYLHDRQTKASVEASIQRLEFAPEMKMETGYFAYHGLVYFHSGRIAEVQIYSQMSYQWRRISHRVYERRRVTQEQPMEFDTPEARLISLGHLLHLAECEVEKLLREEPKPAT